ncbi:MAG: hemolysin III family protein [Ktedonobacteraceae bacterium]
MIPPGSIETVPQPIAALKPLLRGWFHAFAALASIIFTIILCWRSYTDLPRLLSLLIYGLSMIELYTVSATYHIGTWSVRTRRTLRALDHANIFVLIAGTYTPLCFNLLNGWLRPTILILIWFLAILGVGLATLTLHTPRWLTAGLYVAMGWVVIFALPAFLAIVPWIAVACLLIGGVLYTFGALIYARRWPDPFPRFFGFHEIFHLFVIAGSIAFAVAVWVWAVPFPRV